MDNGAVLDEVTTAKPRLLFTGLLSAVDAVDGRDMDPEVRQVVAVLYVHNIQRVVLCAQLMVCALLVRQARK